MFKVRQFIEAYRNHRQMRERQILDQLRAGQTHIRPMVEVLYAAVHPGLHPAAAHSVWAHLIDLVTRGEVVSDGPPELNSAYRLFG